MVDPLLGDSLHARSGHSTFGNFFHTIDKKNTLYRYSIENSRWNSSSFKNNRSQSFSLIMIGLVYLVQVLFFSVSVLGIQLMVTGFFESFCSHQFSIDFQQTINSCSQVKSAEKKISTKCNTYSFSLFYAWQRSASGCFLLQTKALHVGGGITHSSLTYNWSVILLASIFTSFSITHSLTS